MPLYSHFIVTNSKQSIIVVITRTYMYKDPPTCLLLVASMRISNAYAKPHIFSNPFVSYNHRIQSSEYVLYRVLRAQPVCSQRGC